VKKYFFLLFLLLLLLFSSNLFAYELEDFVRARFRMEGMEVEDLEVKIMSMWGKAEEKAEDIKCSLVRLFKHEYEKEMYYVAKFTLEEDKYKCVIRVKSHPDYEGNGLNIEVHNIQNISTAEYVDHELEYKFVTLGDESLSDCIDEEGLSEEEINPSDFVTSDE